MLSFGAGENAGYLLLSNFPFETCVMLLLSIPFYIYIAAVRILNVRKVTGINRASH